MRSKSQQWTERSVHMAHVLVVTSGKGGVGKTTSTAALGAALARGGERVAVIDFDVGLRNLDLLMGAERRVVYDLIHVVQGTAKLTQALIRDKRIDSLFLLAASQTRDKDSLPEGGGERARPAGGGGRGEPMDKFLLLTRYDPIRAERGEMLGVEDVLDILCIPLLGIIPESKEVLNASNMGTPVTLSNPASAPARAYDDVARRLRGESVPLVVASDKS